MILFETLSQPYILLILIISGFCSGLFFDIANLITFLCNNNKIVKNFLQAIATILSFTTLFFVNLFTNYGQFRFYIFVVFTLFLILEQITLGKIIAKTQNKCYTLFKKIVTIFTKDNKHGKRQKEKT